MLVVLVRVPLIAAPEPLEAIPVRLVVLSLVQLNVVPDTAFGFVTLIVLVAIPEQSVCVVGVAAASGLGFTVTVNVLTGP